LGKKGVCIDVKYVNNRPDWRLPALPERRDARERHGADDLLHVFHELSKPRTDPFFVEQNPVRQGRCQAAIDE